MSAGAGGAPDRHATPADLPRLRRLLLQLINPAAAREAAGTPLTQAEWQQLDALAATHRLRPLLAWLHRDDPRIPVALRETWRAARRAGAAQALRAAGELRRVVALLAAEGHAPIALKGAWLAWHAYPEPALRPMRDLDLLLPAGTALAAFRCLERHGYRSHGHGHLPAAEAARLSKHMPPLLAPSGVWIELHQRLAEPPGRMDHRAPLAPLAGAAARAITADGIRYLEPTDLVAHLAIHAAYDHRLDCGPLLLTDMVYAVAASPIDWDRFWADAAREGWERGARLVLQLAAQFAPDAPIVFPSGQTPPPAALIALAPDLLLQDLDTRQSAGVLASTRLGGWRGLLARSLRMRARAGAAQPARADFAVEGGYWAWATSRLARTLRELSRGDVRRQSRRLAALSGWLDQAS